MVDKMEIMMNPKKYGYEQCPHCNGYGSSLKDKPEQIKCSVCGGLGLVKVDVNCEECVFWESCGGVRMCSNDESEFCGQETCASGTCDEGQTE